MNLLKIAVAAAALLAAPGAWAAECAPTRMVKVTYRNITPGRNPAAMTPITLYRLGERYGRVEEARGDKQSLAVIAEPDIWFVNPTDKTGRHLIDPSPVLEFRAPALGGSAVPDVFKRMEIGCELDFIAAYAPRPTGEMKVDGQVLDRHQVSLGADRMEILVRRGVRQVHSVAHYKGEQVQTMLRYLDYAIDLAPDMSLFAKPAGYAITEVPPPAAKPKS